MSIGLEVECGIRNCLDVLKQRNYAFLMRTTVTIDDDVLAAAKALAKQNGTSLGRALSEMARRGFKTSLSSDEGTQDAVFNVDTGADPITSEDVYRVMG